MLISACLLIIFSNLWPSLTSLCIKRRLLLEISATKIYHLQDSAIWIFLFPYSPPPPTLFFCLFLLKKILKEILKWGLGSGLQRYLSTEFPVYFNENKVPKFTFEGVDLGELGTDIKPGSFSSPGCPFEHGPGCKWMNIVFILCLLLLFGLSRQYLNHSRKGA